MSLLFFFKVQNVLEISNLFSIFYSALDDVDLGPKLEDSVEGEMWMSRSDGSITVVSCNQYGWLDSKVTSCFRFFECGLKAQKHTI